MRMNKLDYQNKMRKVRPVQFFGIEPLWDPETPGDVEGFVHDEVLRQFHDTRVWEDGGRRIKGMLNAWHYAQGRASLPTVRDIRVIGTHIEPRYNGRGFRHVNAIIGGRTSVFPLFIPRCMELLVARAGDVVPGPSDSALPHQLFVEAFREQVNEIVNTVDDWYLAFEWIHPFRDGNGRTGKVLHNWLNGTLDDPVLVSDYFGSGNP